MKKDLVESLKFKAKESKGRGDSQTRADQSREQKEGRRWLKQSKAEWMFPRKCRTFPLVGMITTTKT